MPPLSIQARLPPPAPNVRMSIIGIWIGNPNSISKLVVKLSRPPTTVEHVGRGAAHVEGDEVIDADQPSDLLGADHAAASVPTK